MKVLDSALPEESYSHSHKFLLRSSKGSPKLSAELLKEFQNIDVVLNSSGVTFRNNSRDMAMGPFLSLSEISSSEVGRYFGIPSKRVFAFILALTRGLPTDHKSEMKEKARSSHWSGLRK